MSIKTIYRDKKGSEMYYVDVRFLHDRTKRGRQWFPLTKQGYEEAKEYERHFKLNGEDYRRSFYEMIDEYQKKIKMKNEFTTYDKKVGHIRNYIKPFFKDSSLRSIRQQDILDWFDWLSTKKINNVSKNERISTLKQIFDLCVERKLLMSNLISKTQFFEKNEYNEDKEYSESEKIITREEFRKLDHYFYNNLDMRYALYFRILYVTGMRAGEAMALKYSDFDFENMIVRVNRAAKVKGSSKHYPIGLTKAKNRRVVGISETTKTKVLDYINCVEKSTGVKPNQNDFMFKLGDTFLAKESVRRRFKKGLDECKINDHKLHSLRHSYATMLIMEDEINIEIVSKLMGHNDIRTTQNTYAHLLVSKGYGSNDF